MSSLHRIVRACVLTALLLTAIGAVAASGATAATFYVNERDGSDTNSCKGQGPTEVCLTIGAAVTKAEAVTGHNTIEVAEGEYSKSVSLTSEKDKGLTIVGEEPGVEIIGETGKAALTVGVEAGAVTISNLTIANRTGTHAIADSGAALTLDNVTVQDEAGENGIEAKKPSSLTINGGNINVEAGGYAVLAEETPLVLNNSVITVGEQSESDAGGIESTRSGLSLTNSRVDIESGKSEFGQAILAIEDGSVSLQGVSVRQNDSLAPGIVLESSPTTANGLTVAMLNATSTADAINSGHKGANSSFSHLEVSGTWGGIGLLFGRADLTVIDSRLLANPSHTASALLYSGEGESKLLVQRSLLQAGSNATRATLAAANGNVIVDSSEILGGVIGAFFENQVGGTRTFTLASSTVDAGAPGVINDAFGVLGVESAATGISSTANFVVEGSIVLESQGSVFTAGNQASVNCSYTATPNQTQAVKGTEGAINCAGGANGNTNSSGELATLFAEPLTNYILSPTSSAVDSIPTGAVSLPFGIAPSTTDLAGNPRVVDGNGDCVARQDKGALELQGHSAPCTKPPAKPPVAGSITNLSIAPNAFLAAPSGATISKKKKAKKKYGATVSYRDSQAAIAKFTVLKPTPGRTQGKSCKKPSKKNRHGKRCTIYKSLGSFTRVDAAGANKFHFSGRVNGQKLVKGTYLLQVVPHNAAGNGKTVRKQFKIK